MHGLHKKRFRAVHQGDERPETGDPRRDGTLDYQGQEIAQSICSKDIQLSDCPCGSLLVLLCIVYETHFASAMGINPHVVAITHSPLNSASPSVHQFQIPGPRLPQ